MAVGGETVTPERFDAARDRVKALGDAKGQDWRLVADGPRTPGERNALAKTEAKERFLVERRVEPKRDVSRAGDTTKHTVGGDLAAETFPDPAGGWVSREHGISSRPGETRDNPYRTEAAAEKNSTRWADATAKDATVREYKTPKDLEKHFEDTRDDLIGGGDAATHATVFRLVVPDGAKAFRPVVKDNPDRGADGFVPGDKPGDDADNTYGLPDGQPIAREFRKWVRRWRDEYLAFLSREGVKLLGTNPGIGSPLTIDWPPLADYADPMQAAFTPLISAYWDEAGKRTRERLGLDPGEWRVVDPNTHRLIADQAHAFCENTLATTELTAQQAYQELRRELIEGVVFEGEAIPALAKRVKAIFGEASQTKAVQIARTEASRAVNMASIESAKQSGVVAGKKWLLSSNACDQCHAVADRVNAMGGVPLDSPFADGLSDKAEYATCQAPPLHPSCRCTTTLVLTPEYQSLVDANPPGGYQPGPMGPED